MDYSLLGLSLGFPRQEYWSGLPFLSLITIYENLIISSMTWVKIWESPSHPPLREDIYTHTHTHKLIHFIEQHKLASQVAQWWRIHLSMQETQVQSLSWENPLQKEMASHSSILAWKIPWTEEPGGLQSMGHKESDTTEWLSMSIAETNNTVKQLYSNKKKKTSEDCWTQLLCFQPPGWNFLSSVTVLYCCMYCIL